MSLFGDVCYSMDIVDEDELLYGGESSLPFTSAEENQQQQQKLNER